MPWSISCSRDQGQWRRWGDSTRYLRGTSSRRASTTSAPGIDAGRSSMGRVASAISSSTGRRARACSRRPHLPTGCSRPVTQPAAICCSPRSGGSCLARPMKAAAFALLRLVVSAAILAAILSRISVPHPVSRATNGAALYLVAALGCGLVSIVLVALRWRVLARWFGLAMPAVLAVRALFLGVFGGQLLPSSLGIDLLRGWLVTRHVRGTGRIAASVIVDRLVALFALCLLFTLANPAPKQIPLSYAPLFGPIAVLATGALLVAFIFGCGERPQGRPLIAAIG